MNSQFFSKTNKSLIASAFLLATTIMGSTNAMAAPGKLVLGDDGELWCCPGGEKGPRCGPSKAHIDKKNAGSDCGFADPLPTGSLVDTSPTRPVKQATGIKAVQFSETDAVKTTKQIPGK
ncbi:hypothetical protein ACO0LD_18055 [Undibacterium sp. Ji83W]|uniref:hypothetical protein n=1 Tax=Undibacterium sp. Ji83W TaxID=3413043 RepID=UPI003BF07133